MSYCPKCGKKLAEGSVICSDCGNAVSAETAPDKAAEYKNIPGWTILCFLFPIIGLILYLIWKDKYPARAQSCSSGAIIAVVFLFVLLVAAAVLLTLFGALVGGLRMWR